MNLEGGGPQASPGSSHHKESVLGVELAEVCMDMMSKYTYSNVSSLPSRYIDINYGKLMVCFSCKIIIFGMHKP